MEYIQTILLQIDASRLDQASQSGGLLAELDEHRGFLKQQPGFRDLRITRSINAEGNVLIVIETRWADDTSLLRYETTEPNVASIVDNHRDIIVPGSLQVLDMEAIRTESSWIPAEEESEAQQRVVWPILIPAGVLAFTLLLIYGLSRVYLEISGSGATALAAGISIGILIISFFVAANRNLRGWQIWGILLLCGAVLFGATIWAVAEKDETKAEETTAASPTGGAPGGAPGGGPGGSPAAEVVLMKDNFFEFNGQENPNLSAKAGSENTIQLRNDGNVPHNMRIDGPDGQFNTDDDAKSVPEIVNGGKDGSIKFTLAAGTYNYECELHPAQMKGKIQVQ
jgi:plastocyanin/heme-degrading monooxygenase HmoA